MKWSIEYIKEAQRDLKKLDPYNQKLIIKAIEKTSEHPLPPPAGIGKPLSNNLASKLKGYYKIKLKNMGYRVVYALIKQSSIMKIIIISIRNDDEVYKQSEARIRKMNYRKTQE